MRGVSVKAFVRRLTVDAWMGLMRDHPPDPNPSPRAVYEVLGLYLVGAIVLALNYYMSAASYGWLPEAWTASLPAGSRRIWWSLCVSVNYMVLPYLYLRFVLKRSLRDMGFRAEGFVEHLPIYLLFFAVVFPLVVLVADSPHFLQTYPMARKAAGSWDTLLVWECAYALQFVTLEFFFRGFLVFGPARVVGAWVIPFMSIPYLMIHFPKPFLESMGAIIAGMALGMVALRTRSILAGILIHLAVAFTMEILALHHKGQLASLWSGQG